jgi:hypothetical protein
LKAGVEEVAQEFERLLLEQGGDSCENSLAVLHCGDYVSLVQFDDLPCVAACPWEADWVACRWSKKWYIICTFSLALVVPLCRDIVAQPGGLAFHLYQI